ncbi:hypothetical protein FALBO_9942 [Fusarium albosuccineum]|uniref:Uncharacterized protein n=1 Tax=Fusarium albosuccineum TaxID=1237068 RepID=A0A8H4L8G1_9HYPO|nr:hypothetical protein FALBO_9942 [Fusarium albosuccineum]
MSASALKAKASSHGSSHSKGRSSSSRVGKRKSSNAGDAQSTKRRKTLAMRSKAKANNGDDDDDDDGFIELPLLKDFEGPYGIPRDQYLWGPLLAVPKEESIDDDATAPPPCVPVPCSNGGPQKRPVHAARALDLPPRVNVAVVARAGIKINKKAAERKNKKLSLMDMPLEIREEIYRNILVSHKPIPVYDGWKRVYQREKPGLDISILLVKKRIYAEALRILYGGNTFLYRLRDAPGQSYQMVGALQLAHLDDYVPGGEGEDTDDSITAHEPGTINIAKFAGLFRHLSIQADHNRHSAETQQFMADAIKVFATKPGETNIQTLSIMISPRYMNGDYTFVNFFKADSNLIEALKGVCCEMLHIKISNKYLNEGNGHRSTEITMALHHLRFVKYLAQQRLEGKNDIRKADPWKDDWLMKKFRRNKFNKINELFGKLEDQVFGACRRHVQQHVVNQSDQRDALGGGADDDEEENNIEWDEFGFDSDNVESDDDDGSEYEN